MTRGYARSATRAYRGVLADHTTKEAAEQFLAWGKERYGWEVVEGGSTRRGYAPPWVKVRRPGGNWQQLRKIWDPVLRMTSTAIPLEFAADYHAWNRERELERYIEQQRAAGREVGRA